MRKMNLTGIKLIRPFKSSLKSSIFQIIIMLFKYMLLKPTYSFAIKTRSMWMSMKIVFRKIFARGLKQSIM